MNMESKELNNDFISYLLKFEFEVQELFFNQVFFTHMSNFIMYFFSIKNHHIHINFCTMYFYAKKIIIFIDIS